MEEELGGTRGAESEETREKHLLLLVRDFGRIHAKCFPSCLHFEKFRKEVLRLVQEADDRKKQSVPLVVFGRK